MESEPRHGIDELTFALDKVRDPERAIAQKDRHFASLTQPQQLTLNGARRRMIDVHGSSQIGSQPLCNPFPPVAPAIRLSIPS